MAEPTVLLDNEFASLQFHPDAKIIHHQFKKYITGAPFREVLNVGFDKLKKERARKWLSDDRHNSVLREDDEAWSSGQWFPKVLAAGWKFWAIVLPEKTAGKMNMQRFAAQFSKQGLTVQVFTDPEPALQWLESV